jgi:hypothetical protein
MEMVVGKLSSLLCRGLGDVLLQQVSLEGMGNIGVEDGAPPGILTRNTATTAESLRLVLPRQKAGLKPTESRLPCVRVSGSILGGNRRQQTWP